MGVKDKIYTIALGTAFLLQCASAIPKPDKMQFEKAKQTFPEITMEAAVQGRELYISRCSGCHQLKPVNKFTIQQWDERILPGMGRKAKLTADEFRKIENYLMVVLN